jgi:membrane protease YdiL (CAAX protease family)
VKRSFDYGRIEVKAWYAPILLLMPTVTLLSYVVMRALGLPLPVPQILRLEFLVIFLAFFAGALAEEVGWSGYAIDALQAHWEALRASLLLGMVWALFHIIPLVQADPSPAWIAWWCLFTVSIRVLYTWLYNNAGHSVFAAALFHASSNTSWMLFPDYGSHWSPQIVGIIVAVVSAVVTGVWGPQTLTGYRKTQSRQLRQSKPLGSGLVREIIDYWAGRNGGERCDAPGKRTASIR